MNSAGDDLTVLIRLHSNYIVGRSQHRYSSVAGIAQLVQHWTCDGKVAHLISSRSRRRIVFSRVNFLCSFFFAVLPPPPPHPHPQCYRSGMWKTLVILPKVQVVAFTWTHMHLRPNAVWVGWLCCPDMVWELVTEENKLTCNLSGNAWPQSSQLTGSLWTDSGLKSGIGVHKLIYT